MYCCSVCHSYKLTHRCFFHLWFVRYHFTILLDCFELLLLFVTLSYFTEFLKPFSIVPTIRCRAPIATLNIRKFSYRCSLVELNRPPHFRGFADTALRVPPLLFPIFLCLHILFYIYEIVLRTYLVNFCPSSIYYEVRIVKPRDLASYLYLFF